MSLLFIGDSITDAGRRTPDGAPLGTGYVRDIAETLGPEHAVINTGIGGDRARDLLARCEEDAIAHHPSVLTVYVGVNDTWRRFDRDDPTTTEVFEGHYRELLQRLTGETEARVILVEPFLTPVNDDQLTWLDDLAGKRAVVHALAEEFGLELIPLHSVLTAAAAEHGPEAIAADGVHPTPLGHRLIADEWIALARV